MRRHEPLHDLQRQHYMVFDQKIHSKAALDIDPFVHESERGLSLDT